VHLQELQKVNPQIPVVSGACHSGRGKFALRIPEEARTLDFSGESKLVVPGKKSEKGKKGRQKAELGRVRCKAEGVFRDSRQRLRSAGHRSTGKGKLN